MLTLPLYMVAIGLLAIGVGWVVSSLHVYLRDTAQALTLVLTFWFWTTPVFIAESQYPHKLRFLLHINPLAYLVGLSRSAALRPRSITGGCRSDCSVLRRRVCARRAVFSSLEARLRGRSLNTISPGATLIPI